MVSIFPSCPRTKPLRFFRTSITAAPCSSGRTLMKTLAWPRSRLVTTRVMVTRQPGWNISSTRSILASSCLMSSLTWAIRCEVTRGAGYLVNSSRDASRKSPTCIGAEDFSWMPHSVPEGISLASCFPCCSFSMTASPIACVPRRH
jgi:hypothetical protein